jgi:Spy/CpxP family protein refolding chaperone
MSIIKAPVAALLLLSLILLVAGQALAQAPPERRTTRENIVTLMLLRMTQVLDIDEEQAARLYPLVNRIEKEKLALTRQAGARLRELRSLLQDGEPDPQEMRRLIEEIHDLRGQIKGKDAEVQGFVDENLTLEQQAKFLIFFQDFNQYLREKLQEARQQAPRKRPPDNQR